MLRSFSDSGTIEQNTVKLQEDYNKTHGKHILHAFSFLYKFSTLKFCQFIERCYITDQMQSPHTLLSKRKSRSIFYWNV